MSAKPWLGLVLLAGCEVSAQTVTWRFEVDNAPADCDVAGVGTVRLVPIYGGRDGGPGRVFERRCSDGDTWETDLVTGVHKSAPVRWEGTAGGMLATAQVQDDQADLVFVGATVRTRWTLEKAGAPTTCAALSFAQGWDPSWIRLHFNLTNSATCEDDPVRSHAFPLTAGDVPVTGRMEAVIPDSQTGNIETRMLAEAAATATIASGGTDVVLLFQIP